MRARRVAGRASASDGPIPTSDPGAPNTSSESSSTTTSGSTSTTSTSTETSASDCPLINPGEGCPCGLEGDCEGGHTCNPILDACVPDLCDAGREGCECPYGICKEGLRCTQGFCTNTACPTGTLGCNCIPNAWCKDDLACIDGVCT